MTMPETDADPAAPRTPTPPQTLAERLAALRLRIESASHIAGRAEPLLLAVSKKQPTSAIVAAYQAGLRAFGESYVNEAITKIEALGALPDLEWHFIGPLQSNKTALVAAHFDWVHSIDRLKVAQRLNDQRPPHLPPINLCVQVNLDQEVQKAGIEPDKLGSLLAALRALPRIRIRGLMCIPAQRDDFAAQRVPFRQLADLYTHWAPIMGSDWDTLSMGMSDDLEAAILEGSTIIRVGTALFGEREAAQPDTA